MFQKQDGALIIDWPNGSNNDFPVLILDESQSKIFSIDGLGRATIGSVAEAQTPASAGVILTAQGGVFAKAADGDFHSSFSVFQGADYRYQQFSDGTTYFGGLSSLTASVSLPLPTDTRGVAVDPNGTVHIQALDGVEQDLFVGHWGDIERCRIDNYGTLICGTLGKTVPPASDTTRGVVVAASGGVYVQGPVSAPEPAFRVYEGTTQTYSISIQGNVTGPSDERLKTDIVFADACLERLKGVPVRSFAWKTEPERKQLGIIAQEAQEKFPELITQGEDGFLFVTQSQIPFLLMQALQELAQYADGLERRLAVMEARLAKLER
jgi:hypothetical protein